MKQLQAFLAWVEKLLGLFKKAKALFDETVISKERSIDRYWKIGRRYFSKRFVVVACLLIILIPLYIYLRPPALLANWFGWPTKLIEGSKQAKAFQGLGEVFSREGHLQYVGQVVKGVYEGAGKLYNDKGVLIYDGAFKKGLPNGTGTQYNGMKELVYQGEFKDGTYSGKGQMFHSSGKLRYDGDFKNGKMQGTGTKYYVTGKIQYTGEFVNDEFAGNGTLYDSNGNVQYDGGFLNGKYEGAGKLFNEQNQLVYAGNFAAGAYSGAGKLYGSSGKPLFDGTFQNGEYSGDGTEYYADGKLKYKGSFAAGKYQGDGKLFANTGTPLYTGAFVNGLFEGEGEKFDSQGLPLYKGQFKLGAESGQGERYDAKGTTVYKGFFQHDRIYYPGFLGLAPKALEGLLDKATDTTVDTSNASPTLKMLYDKYQMTFQLEISKANDKDSLVTSVEVWNPSGLQDIDAIVHDKDPADAETPTDPTNGSGGTPKGASTDNQPTMIRSEGNVQVYRVGDALYYCYYQGDKLLRAMVSAATK